MSDKPKGATYDREADAINVFFVPEGAEYDSSEEIAPGIVLDYDTHGWVIGVELLSVRRRLMGEGELLDAVRKLIAEEATAQAASKAAT